MGPLLFNILLYLSATLFLVYKYKKLNIIIFITLFYLSVSIFSLVIWINNIYYEATSKLIINDISYTPFIISFLIFVIIFSPITKFNENNIKRFILPNNLQIILITVPAVVIGLILFIAIPINIFQLGLNFNFNTIYDVGKEYNIGILPYYVEILFTIYSIFYPLLLFIFFYVSAYYKEKKMILFILVLVTFFPKIFYGIANVSRGMIFFSIFDYFIMLLLFKKFISNRIQNIVKAFFLIVLAISVLFSIFITFSRYGEGIMGYLSIFKYFGESFLNYNTIIWNHVSHHPMGERFFPDLFYSFNQTLVKFPNELSKKLYFVGMTGVPIYVFKTLVGDIYVEFGYLGMVLFSILISFLGKRYIILENKFPIHRFIPLFFFYQLAVGGVFDFIYQGHVRFLITVGYILLYLYLRFDFRRMVFYKR